MHISILVDNKSHSKEFECEHGLSVHIKVGDEHYLFDMGQTDKFIRNAEKLNIDLKKLNLAIVSHGHYDHGGGLINLLNLNPNIQIAINKSATCQRYSVSTIMTKYNGLPNPDILIGNNIKFIDGIVKISEHLTLFTLPTPAPVNNHLMAEHDGVLQPDTFPDEIFGLITEDNKKIIYGGCTHHGIKQLFSFCKNKLNIQHLDAFIGGIHLNGQDIEKINMAIDSAQAIDVKQWIINHCSGDTAIYEWGKRFLTLPQKGFSGSEFDI